MGWHGRHMEQVTNWVFFSPVCANTNTPPGCTLAFALCLCFAPFVSQVHNWARWLVHHPNRVCSRVHKPRLMCVSGVGRECMCCSTHTHSVFTPTDPCPTTPPLSFLHPCSKVPILQSHARSQKLVAWSMHGREQRFWRPGATPDHNIAWLSRIAFMHASRWIDCMYKLYMTYIHVHINMSSLTPVTYCYCY